ncbi:MAG: hypothetical protein L0241_25750 [Planctomycetia bacterium]|nr:hypothetical protein [Planctomycetia bacterium]
MNTQESSSGSRGIADLVEVIQLLAAQQQANRVFAAYAKVLPGTVLDGKYRLEEEPGAGGFGVVFRARHLVLDCPIAIKVFRTAEELADVLANLSKKLEDAPVQRVELRGDENTSLMPAVKCPSE